MIDTALDGDAANLRAWATWLRSTLGDQLEESGDLAVRARSVARDGWHGEGGAAYVTYNRAVVLATDDHQRRVVRGAQALDDLAAALGRAEREMGALRVRAVQGGLSVTGSIIHAPTAAPGGVFEPGSEAESAHRDAVARVELYDALLDEAQQVREHRESWVDAHLPADVEDAEDDDDLRKLVSVIKAHYPDLAEGAGIGLNALAAALRAQRRRFLHQGRRSGDPRIRNQHRTPRGSQHVDDLARRSRLLEGLGKLFGKAALPLAVGVGVYEGATTGDWVKPVLVIGAGLAVAALVPPTVVSLSATAPVAVVAALSLAAAIAASAGIEKLYEEFEVRSRIDDAVDDAGSWAEDRWRDVEKGASRMWDTVTPW